MFLFLWVLHTACSSRVFGSTDFDYKARVTLKEGFFRNYSLGGHHSRVEILQGPENGMVYVGANFRLLLINFEAPKKSKEVIWQHNVTVLLEDKSTDTLFVCGTNGTQICCSMETLGTCRSLHKADGIAPISVDERAPSLFVDGELYSTAGLSHNRNRFGIRRDFQNIIWPAPNKTEQRYISLALSGPRVDQLQDRVYTFLMEKNLDSHPEASPWIPCVSQVCRVDHGGSKNILQQSWTSHLTARLSCGIRHKNVYFTELLDVAVLHAETWSDSRVYALFRNIWNMSAICVYTMGDIDKIFTNSAFKGHSEQIPTPRPGMCVNNSKTLPDKVLNMAKEQLQMERWVQPVSDKGMMIFSHQQYTHIRVDQVKGSGPGEHTVLLLALEDGRIHKVLEQKGQPFIVAELQPLQPGVRVLNMLLQATTKKLYVCTSTEVLEVDLLTCESYGENCELCIQARDPYCGWDPRSRKCTVASSHTIQDVENASPSVCTKGKACNSEKYISQEITLDLLPSGSCFLRCPMPWAHAEYSWHYQGTQQQCVYTEEDCLLLIDNVNPQQDRMYWCEASEGGYRRTIMTYRLKIVNKAWRLAHQHSGILCILILIALFL
ncbi:semaphorin-7A-like isoform X1 [Arapaima gigas]